MRKIIYSILIIIISISYCIQLNAENIESEQTETTELEKLQTQNTEIQQQIEENINQLGIIEEELTQNLLKIQEVDNEILISQEKVNKLDEEIEALNNEIKRNQEDIQEKQKEYNKQKKLTDERMLAICESGDLQYIDVLLGSTNIIEFVSNYYLITEIYKSDMKLLETANKQKQELEKISQELNEKKQELSEKKKKQQTEEQLLENTKTARQIQISKLSEQEQNLQLQIDEYRIQVSAIETEIRSLAQVATFGEDYIGEKMIWPISGYTTITSQFGMRVHPITGLYRLHTGTDVSAPIGTDFVAMATGVVTKAEYNYSYGNMVIIDHGGGVQTLYAHGSEIVAQLGQLVQQGTPVLKVGSTGYSTGPHAHFEIRINGEAVNPLDYVEPQ